MENQAFPAVVSAISTTFVNHKNKSGQETKAAMCTITYEVNGVKKTASAKIWEKSLSRITAGNEYLVKAQTYVSKMDGASYVAFEVTPLTVRPQAVSAEEFVIADIKGAEQASAALARIAARRAAAEAALTAGVAA